MSGSIVSQERPECARDGGVAGCKLRARIRNGYMHEHCQDLENGARMKPTKDWYEGSYATQGFSAQRRYPNEEFLRFMGENFFSIEKTKRRNVKILEVGCGSGANLWMVAREGYEAYGLDLSVEALKLCKNMLDSWDVSANLAAASMISMPYQKGIFSVVDVFSAYCLNEQEFSLYLDEVERVTSPGGCFFSYAPSKNSDAFKNYEPAGKIDESTLDGIARVTSPYAGNAYPFRFVSQAEYTDARCARGFKVISNERVARSYRSGEEYFEFVSISGQKL